MRNSWQSWRNAVAFAVVASGIGVSLTIFHGSSRSAAPKAQDGSGLAQPSGVAAAPAPSADDSDLHVVTPEERAAAPQLPAVVHAATRSAPAPAASQGRPEPTPYTRQLVSALTNFDLDNGPITPDQAQQWKQALQTLTAQGAAAVPAIREFLEQNQEVNFRAVSGGDLLGQSSIRSAFVNALGQISGPEATEGRLSANLANNHLAG